MGTFYLIGNKKVYYKGEWITADSEELAKMEYKSAILNGHVKVEESNLDVDVVEEEADEKGE